MTFHLSYLNCSLKAKPKYHLLHNSFISCATPSLICTSVPSYCDDHPATLLDYNEEILFSSASHTTFNNMLCLKWVFHKAFGIYCKHPKDWYRKKKSFSTSKKFDLGGYRNEEGPLWQEKQASALPLGVTAWRKSCQRMLTLSRCFYESINVWVLFLRLTLWLSFAGVHEKCRPGNPCQG